MGIVETYYSHFRIPIRTLKQERVVCVGWMLKGVERVDSNLLYFFFLEKILIKTKPFATNPVYPCIQTANDMDKRKRLSRKAQQSTMGNNLKMNDEVYALRREVMGYLYEAKNLLRTNGIDMPRVNVRITDNRGESEAIGQARLSDVKIIWISTAALTTWKPQLREVVYHELVHTLTGYLHDDNCPLMSPCVNLKPLPKKRLEKAFLKYFKN